MPTMQKFVAPLALFLGVLSAPAAPVFHVNPPRLPDATVGKVYAGGPLLLQGGGQCPRNLPSVRVVAGSLPGGMYLSAAGEFGGAPSEGGRYEFVVRVENGCGWSDQPLTIEVAGPPMVFANPAALEFRVAPGQAVAPSSIQVSSTTAGLAYTAESTAPWVRVRPRMGRTPGVNSGLSADLLDVEIDTASLSPGWHQASIDIGAWRVAQPVSVPVRVEVVGGGPLSRGDSDPRLPRIVLGPAPMSAEHAPVDIKSRYAGPESAAHAPSATATPNRLSRSAQLRSKYLATKAAAPAPAHPTVPPSPAAAKPSPVGEPVKKTDGHAPPPPPASHEAAKAHAPAAPAPQDKPKEPAAASHDKPKEAAKKH